MRSARCCRHADTCPLCWEGCFPGARVRADRCILRMLDRHFEPALPSGHHRDADSRGADLRGAVRVPAARRAVGLLRTPYLFGSFAAASVGSHLRHQAGTARDRRLTDRPGSGVMMFKKSPQRNDGSREAEVVPWSRSEVRLNLVREGARRGRPKWFVEVECRGAVGRFLHSDFEALLAGQKRVIESSTEEPLLYFASPSDLAPTSFAMKSMTDVAQGSVALLVESEDPRPLAVLTAPEIDEVRRCSRCDYGRTGNRFITIGPSVVGRRSDSTRVTQSV